MKQEDLNNLKIEDLEEVTEGYWVDGEEMILKNYIEIDNIYKVFTVVKNEKYSIYMMDENGEMGVYQGKAYKIPQPKMRDMNNDEIKGYLHELNKLNYIEVDCKGDGDFQHYTNHTVFFSDDIYRTIDKNGKVTEFKLPQIEAKHASNE